MEQPQEDTQPGLARRAARSTREAIRKNPRADRVYRTSVGVVGGTTTALGIVLMPLPGPGALVTLGGLAILATEFKTPGKMKDVGVKAFKKAEAKAEERRNSKRAEFERDTASP